MEEGVRYMVRSNKRIFHSLVVQPDEADSDPLLSSEMVKGLIIFGVYCSSRTG